MINYSKIEEYIIHKFLCSECNKKIKIKILKDKLPDESKRSGIYSHKGKVKCSKCSAVTGYLVKIFYKIKKKNDTEKKPRLYLGSYKEDAKYNKRMRSPMHRIKVHCRRCMGMEGNLKDCRTLNCEFYGVLKQHKNAKYQLDEDFWWAVPIRELRESHDKHYKNKCRRTNKEIREEYKESSVIANSGIRSTK